MPLPIRPALNMCNNIHFLKYYAVPVIYYLFKCRLSLLKINDCQWSKIRSYNTVNVNGVISWEVLLINILDTMYQTKWLNWLTLLRSLLWYFLCVQLVQLINLHLCNVKIYLPSLVFHVNQIPRDFPRCADASPSWQQKHHTQNNW